MDTQIQNPDFTEVQQIAYWSDGNNTDVETATYMRDFYQVADFKIAYIPAHINVDDEDTIRALLTERGLINLEPQLTP